MENDLSDALKKDLGRDTFMNWFTETSGLYNDIDHSIAHLTKWAKPLVVDTPMLIGPGKSKIVYEPLGVICIMGSWNFPLFTTLGPLIAVITAGNCAVVKPSEFCPNTTKKMKSLIAR